MIYNKNIKLAASPVVPVHRNDWDVSFEGILSPEQRQAIRVLPDAAGGDKLVNPKAVQKSKAAIDSAKEKALSEIDSTPTPIDSTIHSLKAFRASFVQGKSAAQKNIGKKRNEAENAKAVEKAKKDADAAASAAPAADALDAATTEADKGDTNNVGF